MRLENVWLLFSQKFNLVNAFLVQKKFFRARCYGVVRNFVER